jgi:hypothetical protein
MIVGEGVRAVAGDTSAGRLVPKEHMRGVGAEQLIQDIKRFRPSLGLGCGLIEAINGPMEKAIWASLKHSSAHPTTAFE